MTKQGELIAHSLITILAHELSHATTLLEDDHSLLNLEGRNVQNANEWFSDLGIPELASYHAQEDLSQPTPASPGIQYTSGYTVKNVIVDRGTSVPFFEQVEDLTSLDLPSSGVSGTSLIIGGESNNVYVGTTANDWLYGGAGSDLLIGGGGTNFINGQEGEDWTSYAVVTSAVALSFAGSGSEPQVTASWTSGNDTLVSIEKIVGTDHDDTFTFSGSLTSNIRVRIEAGAGQTGNNDIDLGDAVGSTIRVRVTDEGLELAPIGGGTGKIELIGFSYDAAILGSNNGRLTVELASKGSTFKSGAGGADITLKAGDKAYGYDGAVDIFRVTTTAPAGLSAAEQIEYLKNNRVFIGNFGAEDQIYVDGILFDGAKVTSTLAPMHQEVLETSAWLSGQSSFGLNYVHAVWNSQTERYDYPAGRVRDVAFAGGEDASAIIFLDRSVAASSAFLEGHSLQSIASSDQMLVIAISGFVDGEGSISFTNDSLAHRGRPALAIAGELALTGAGMFQVMFGNHEGKVSVGERDYDGDGDGYTAGGGPSVNSDQWAALEEFRPGVDIQSYVGGGDRRSGTSGNDTLDGGKGNDMLFASLGDDMLIGGPGHDQLDGGAGADIMRGGPGDDLYRVDHASDVVIELEGEGYDVVSTALAACTLPDHVEWLSYFGSAAAVLTGNGLANLISSGSADDQLFGLGGDDELNGAGGNDILDGGSGNDVMAGDAGDDTYIVDSAGDQVVELQDHGLDTIRTALAAYSLGENVERLTYTGAAAATLTGSSSSRAAPTGPRAGRATTASSWARRSTKATRYSAAPGPISWRCRAPISATGSRG
jgi:Ca2+-binding RTX toxin-like protein